MVSFIYIKLIIFFYYIYLSFLGTKCRKSYVSMSKKKNIFFNKIFIKYIFFLHIYLNIHLLTGPLLLDGELHKAMKELGKNKKEDHI